MSKLQSWNTITLFCILIFGFTAATLIKPDTEYSETENRTLEQMPDVTLQSVFDGSFEADYETYLTDQFVARDQWIGLKTAVEQAMFKKESKDIYFAEDDYLIEKHTDSFTSDTAALNVRVLQQFAQQYVDVFGAEHMTLWLYPMRSRFWRISFLPMHHPMMKMSILSRLHQFFPREPGSMQERC